MLPTILLFIAAATTYVLGTRDDCWLDERREPDPGFDIEDYREPFAMEF